MQPGPLTVSFLAAIAVAAVLLAIAASFSPVRGTVEYLLGRVRGAIR